MTLIELQEILGDRISKHSNESFDSSERKAEMETSDIISRLGKQMINNADVILRAEKLALDSGMKMESITKIVRGDDGNEEENPST